MILTFSEKSALTVSEKILDATTTSNVGQAVGETSLRLSHFYIVTIIISIDMRKACDVATNWPTSDPADVASLLLKLMFEEGPN